MSSAAETRAELEAALAATLDAAAETRRSAEARLKSLEAQPDALAALLQLARSGGGARDEGTRLAAAIALKNILRLRPTSELEQLAPHVLQAAVSTPHCSSLADALRLLSQLHSGSALALANAHRPQIIAPGGAAASGAVSASHSPPATPASPCNIRPLVSSPSLTVAPHFPPVDEAPSNQTANLLNIRTAYRRSTLCRIS